MARSDAENRRIFKAAIEESRRAVRLGRERSNLGRLDNLPGGYLDRAAVVERDVAALEQRWRAASPTALGNLERDRLARRAAGNASGHYLFLGVEQEAPAWLKEAQQQPPANPPPAARPPAPPAPPATGDRTHVELKPRVDASLNPSLQIPGWLLGLVVGGAVVVLVAMYGRRDAGSDDDEDEDEGNDEDDDDEDQDEHQEQDDGEASQPRVAPRPPVVVLQRQRAALPPAPIQEPRRQRQRQRG